MHSPAVSLEQRANIGLLTINNPPVNALSQAVRQGLLETLRKAISDKEIEAIVIQCSGKTFIAGADISEFGKPPMRPYLPDLLKELQNSSKPIVAALFGTVLGGGFETALSCHYRIALTGTKIGLPEVKLGLIPGAGGTQLLPRVCGIETALELITSGKHVTVESPQAKGVANKIIEADLLNHAISFAQQVAFHKPLVATPLLDVKMSASDKIIFDQYRAKLAKRSRGQLAPQRAIDSIENTLSLSFGQGLEKERAYFLECRESSQSGAMRHAFFAEKAAARVTHSPHVKKPKMIEKIAIIGAGTMGGGIAMSFVDSGFPVTLVETTTQNLERGLAGITQRYGKMVKGGRISQVQMNARLNLITTTCDYQDLSEIDLVVEAAFESMDVKRSIFSKLDTVCKPEAIIASNTSYLNIDEIAESTCRANQVLGMHFFSPANIMKLLEIVRCKETDEATLVSAVALAKRIGKISTVVGMCYGFVGNRMYSCYGREANLLLLEGATPSQIDKAMIAWGMAMGPLTVNDMSGIDIAYKARKENPDLPDDPLYFQAANLLVESGRLGQKTKAGFYQYDDFGIQSDDPVALALFRQEALSLEVPQREVSQESIQTRLIYALINEGSKILEEGIAQRSGDIDVIWLNGYGFPRYMGGPMFYADMLGLRSVLSTIQSLYDETGKDWWKPSELLIELAQTGKSFSDV
uniref:3-hydroxyacyl-CoA dehydrogenase NAD-binding domain-containing protein n=1 Tax=Ningiella ruwaisensis TaxID=2364274 RepID=UPI0010A08F0A|nr:3-hydroxyacyl-CoA dehydrogenase NAD-binding domain-containing protein [Ningiella ruwaisensis]